MMRWRNFSITLSFIIVVQAGWQLTFSDEFNGQSKLDTTKWNVRYPFAPTPINGELQFYSPEGMESGTTYLRIIGEPLNVNGFSYQSGLITTKNKFTQTFGYFEMNAILPAGQGLWPAFWLYHQDTTNRK
jgi:beta-glucanase (GH16 family)